MDLAFEEKGSAVKLLLSRQPLEVLHTRIGSRTYCYGYGIPSSSIHLPNISYGHYDEHRNRNGDLWRPGKRFGKALTPPFLRHLSIGSTDGQMQLICNVFRICWGSRGAPIRSHAKCSYSQPLCGCCSGRYPPSLRITRFPYNGL